MAAVFLISLVEFRHRQLNPDGGKGFDNIEAFLQLRVHDLFLFARPFAQHKIDLASTLEIVSYAEAEPAVFSGAKNLLDTFYSVVAGITPLGAQTDLAERQGKVINENQYIFEWNLLFLHPVMNRPSTEIHESVGF